VDEAQARMAAFRWLSEVTDGGELPVTWAQLQSFSVQGQPVTLVGQRGIWWPAGFSMPISIRTAPPQPGRAAPYDDDITDDGLLRYRYFQTDPSHRDNAGLRRAMATATPLIYLKGIRKGVYHASWPAYILSDHPDDLSVLVSIVDPGELRPDLDPTTITVAERRYYSRLTKQRLHQAAFRVNVLTAYRDSCAMCELKHVELLDAAHIVSDALGGAPIVPNGLALCKIHHAAFDHQIIGLRPDHVLEVREDVLDEIDGPMLRHGLQEMHGRTLALPRRPADRPSREYVEARYEAFLAR
jgi:putative restriction endonuclease